MNDSPDQYQKTPVIGRLPRSWQAVLVVCVIVLSLLLFLVPVLSSGSELWLGIDWIDGRKLYSIDDAYRYFVGKNAFDFPSVFIWNYVMPLALVFDAIAAALTDGSLLGMRMVHAGVGAATLAVIARASLRAGCGPVLASASVLIVGLMPLFLVLSSSFYGEGLFTLLLACAFLLLIEEKTIAVAAVVGLLPMVRPEGAIYCVLFLIYFGLRRDARSCALIALPGVVYYAALIGFSSDWLASVNWRLELRKILEPLGPAESWSIAIDRWLNPLWVGLALAAPLLPAYRKWWPILVGPWLIVGVQIVGIVRGVQDFELRYFFSLLPIVAVAWALPIRRLLDANVARPSRHRVIVGITTVGIAVVVSVHALQSDWIRQFAAYDESQPDLNAQQRVANDFAERTLWFDPRPLRAFAARTDAYLESHESIRSIFVSNSAPLYFLEFPSFDRSLEPIFVPHNPAVARYSGGFFFGFSLSELNYRYYRFSPDKPATAMLIVDDAGQDPFEFSAATGSRGSTSVRRVSANVQSGSMKAYAVSYTAADAVEWSIPSRAAVE